MAGTYKKDGQECILITPEVLKELEDNSRSNYFSAAYPGKGSMRVGDFYAIEFGNIHVFHALEELDTVIETDLQKRLRETMVKDYELSHAFDNGSLDDILKAAKDRSNDDKDNKDKNDDGGNGGGGGGAAAAAAAASSDYDDEHNRDEGRDTPVFDRDDR